MSDWNLVICDDEEDYLSSLVEFLMKAGDTAWRIKALTNVCGLKDFKKDETVDLILIAESDYSPSMVLPKCGRVVILNESGFVKYKDLVNIDKYQSAEKMEKLIGEVLLSLGVWSRDGLDSYKTKFIGLFSPIRRVFQTSFALTMCQMLSKSHRVLYINLEPYSGVNFLLPDLECRDLADLLYFLNSDREKFLRRLKQTVRKIGDMEFIPPMKIGQNLLLITKEEWMSLLNKVAELGKYEYVIMDLSESVQGLFDILRNCSIIYTILSDDEIAEKKMLHYEEILKLGDYEDILKTTRKCTVPIIRSFPGSIEQYGRSELVKTVRKYIEEDIYGHNVGEEKSSTKGSEQARLCEGSVG